ncbi:hypothetical protein Zmor_021936 [Zophobas morio]|uniref:Regulation of nuclear pre-mRNA domain-containing protein 2 n=1 Tax=Zophobas morio TaxID=2755281 RepID=A0AA38I6U3_9CUCU|nr:hypothetical protein Zmor_021936 [Zophobas morio]
MGTEVEEFNVIQFEKRLTALKDSQENINACCKWCLENRQHHKKIVNSWLNVLKRVKVEQRLNLFYLANDVIQYSKRKQYEFVDSWGTALQKATTLVRDDKVKHKIVRIFNIWQQRGVYNEEFISDLCGLISVVPTASKNDEPHEFQANYVVNKIKQCSKLENETDLKLKVLKEHNPKIQLETETLCISLKDRAHVDDVEKELEVYVKHLEGYINALKAEIKCRITNISVLKQANNHLDKDKKDVKVVANAYKVFGNKVKAFQRKLEEHKSTLTSPVPSPDINAPSPSPDCDIDLPDDNEIKTKNTLVDYNPRTTFTAGYYNPVPPPTTEAGNFVTNGYTSFIGSNFNVEELSTSALFTNVPTTVANASLSEVNNSSFNLNVDLSNVLQTIGRPPPPPIEASSDSARFPYQEGGHLPLLPPPMPPFSAKSDYENPYQAYSSADKANYGFDHQTESFNTSNGSNSYPPNAEEYNPEQEPETWEPDASWTQSQLDTDTPESPPLFEKEGYVEGVEYHDTIVTSGAADVDHRILHTLSTELEDIRGRGKDVDHRNLISLTGSPSDTNSSNPVQTDIWNTSVVDKDYRNDMSAINADQDYRLPPFNIEQLKLPPPPPPPPKPLVLSNQFPKNKVPSPRKLMDNIESIDMELSEDENEEHQDHRENLKVIVNSDSSAVNNSSLKPPPPFPDLPDDVDANTFLDDLDNELNSNEFTASLQDPDHRISFDQPPPTISIPPHIANVPPPNLPPPNNWIPKQQNCNMNMGFRRGNRGGPVYNNRGMQRGRGRGTYGFRGANNFRGRGFGRGVPNRGHKMRGNMRGNFQGGY